MYGLVWFCLCLGMYRLRGWDWLPAIAAAFGTALAALFLSVKVLVWFGWE